MNCTTCRGSGQVAIMDGILGGQRYVRCAACSGTGRPLPPKPAPIDDATRAFLGEHSTSQTIEELLLRIPHDSEHSWAAWVYLQSFHSAGLAIAASSLPYPFKLECVQAERDRLAAKLRALLGEVQ